MALFSGLLTNTTPVVSLEQTQQNTPFLKNIFDEYAEQKPSYDFGIWQTPIARVMTNNQFGRQQADWENWLARYGPVGDPVFELYADVAKGNIPKDFKFESLFSGADRAISESEFNNLPPDVQKAARADPQKFMQSVMSNTANKGGSGDLLSIGAEGGYSNYDTATWNPATGITPDKSAYMQVQEEPDWGLYATLALMGGMAYAGYAGMAAGATEGAAAGAAAGEAGAAGAAAGAGTAGSTGGWLTAAEGLAAQEAGFTAAELAGWGGATTAGIGGATAAGGLTQQAMLAEQYASLGYNPATANALAAADIASASGAAGSSLAVQGGMLDTMGSAYNTYSQANKLNNAYKAFTGGGATAAQGGGMATETDWGSMFGNLVGGTGTYLGNQAALNDYQRKTEELANKVKFTPYAISSDIGQTYQDPVTGSMVSRLDPRFAEQQQAMLGAVGSNLAASQADPQLAAQDAYNKMRMLSAFPEEQQRLATENRLLQQGMLGSTGGANQTRAMQEAMNTNNVNQQLQAINLGQTLSNNAMTRAGQAWTGAMAPTTSMQNQMGQSGQFGAYNTGNQQFNANMLNQANQAQAGLKMSGVNSMFGSPAFSSSGQQTGVDGLINQGVNWGVNQVGNWLGGNTATSQPAYGWDQYSGLMGQQDGFNWSGLEGVSAGSTQDMMLNDQWDWSW